MGLVVQIQWVRNQLLEIDFGRTFEASPVTAAIPTTIPAPVIATSTALAAPTKKASTSTSLVSQTAPGTMTGAAVALSRAFIDVSILAGGFADEEESDARSFPEVFTQPAAPLGRSLAVSVEVERPSDPRRGEDPGERRRVEHRFR